MLGHHLIEDLCVQHVCVNGIQDHCQTGCKAGPVMVLILSAACISFAPLYLGVIPALLKALWASLAVVLSPVELTLKQHLEQMLNGSDGVSEQNELV